MQKNRLCFVPKGKPQLSKAMKNTCFRIGFRLGLVYIINYVCGIRWQSEILRT